MEYSIQELSRLSGVTTRTLRWYDQIGLLKPSRVAESGYRYYGGFEYQRTTGGYISVINVPEGMEAELSTKTLTLKIIGTAAQISKLTGDSVFCTVDLSTVTDPSGSMEAPVTVTINNADSCWATGSYTAHVTLSPKTESSTSDASD